MPHKEGIGLGGVMAEVTWLASEDGREGITEQALVKALSERFGTCTCRAQKAIEMAISCKTIVQISGLIYLMKQNGKVT